MPPSKADPLAARLLAFAARLRRRHRHGAALHAALCTGLLLAVPALPLAWLLPPWRLPLLAGVAVVVLASAGLAAARASRLADVALLRLTEGAAVAAPTELAVLGDELGTWLEAHRRGQHSAMTGWLARTIDDQLPQLPPQRLAPIGRRSLGALAWLLPLLLLLLLAILLAELLAPPWPGALGGRPRELPSSGGAGGDGEGEAGAGGAGPPETPAPEPDPQPATDRSPPPPPPGPTAANEPPPVTERPPLLDLPEQQRFLVPEFLGDGPTRRVRMHTAEVEVGAPATAVPPPAGTVPPTPVPLPQQEAFARAAEVAQRARHVPPAERPIVHRYFQALREAAK